MGKQMVIFPLSVTLKAKSFSHVQLCNPSVFLFTEECTLGFLLLKFVKGIFYFTISFFLNNFIYLFLVALDHGLSLVGVYRLLTAVASLIGEHRL